MGQEFELNKIAKIYVAGHSGLVGSAICRALAKQGYKNILIRKSADLDLRSNSDVQVFFEQEQPEFVFVAAAKVGGILANSTQPAEFIYDNLAIATNVIHASWQHKVKKLLFLGSSCIYPRECLQPIKEEYLLSGPLEGTNEFYAIAKIAALKLCQAYNRQYGTHFFTVMPCNVYGPGDNFDLKSSHVLPAIIRKFHEAKISRATRVELWGTGLPFREHLYVDELAEACLFLMGHYDLSDPINIGVGKDETIADIAKVACRVIGYKGEVVFNSAYPDGTSRKLLDVSKLASIGWKASVDLEEGIKKTYRWYQENCENNGVKISRR